jgi:hypothetical protein
MADLAFILSYAWSSVQAVEVITKSRLVFGTLIITIARRRLPTPREVLSCLLIVTGIALFVGSKSRHGTKGMTAADAVPVILGIISCVAVEASIWLEAGLVWRRVVCKNTVKLCTSALAPILIPLAIVASNTLYTDVVMNPKFDPDWEMHAVLGLVIVIGMATWSTTFVDTAVVVAAMVWWFVPALVVAGMASITRKLMTAKMAGHAAGLPSTTSAFVQMVVFTIMIGGDMLLGGVSGTNVAVLMFILCGMALR